MLGLYSHGQSVIFQVSSHQTNLEQKKDIFPILIPAKIEEGQITFMCVEEHKLMGEVNSPPNWHRLETTTFLKKLYI